VTVRRIGAAIGADIAVFAVVLGLLLTWTIGMPLFASPDEPAHLYKAYGTAHGQATGERLSEDLSNIRRFDVPEEMGQSPGIMCWILQAEVPVSCETPGRVGAGESTAAVYPPFWYGVVGGGARLAGQDTSQRAYRAIGAALCAALIATAIAVARRSAAGRTTPLLLLGLAPMTLFLSGSVNPNGFEVAGFMLLWALCLHSGHDRAPTRLGGLLVGGVAAMLLLSRFASAIWLLAGAVVIAVALGVAGVRRFLVRPFLVPALGITGAAVVVLLAWSRYAGVEAEDPRLATDASTWDVVQASWERTPEYLRQMIGILGWLDTRLPWFVYVLFALVTAIAIAGVLLARAPRLLVVTALVAAGVIVVPIAVNVVTARSAGLIWQGRYTLPLFAMLSVLGMLGWQRWLDRRPAETARRVSIGVGIVVASCFVVAEVAAFWQMLRRFSVGASGKVWLDEPLPWRPSVAPLTLIAINAVAVVVFTALVLFCAWRPVLGADPGPPARDRPEPEPGG
jgi:hypothetical protein